MLSYRCIFISHNFNRLLSHVPVTTGEAMGQLNTFIILHTQYPPPITVNVNFELIPKVAIGLSINGSGHIQVKLEKIKPKSDLFIKYVIF